MNLTATERLVWTSALEQQPADASGLADWLSGPLHDFYPFEGLILAHGELVAGEVRVTHMLACGHAPAYVDQLRRSFDLTQRGSLRHWLGSRQPLLIDAARPALHASPFELQEMREQGFRNVAGHGVVNLRSNAGTYFGFTNVRQPLDEAWHGDALRLIAPYLNVLYLQYLAEREAGSRTTLDPLTPRQREIVRSLASGANDKTIGRQLGLSEKTVRNQLSAIYARLGIHKRTELMALLR